MELAHHGLASGCPCGQWVLMQPKMRVSMPRDDETTPRSTAVKAPGGFSYHE